MKIIKGFQQFVNEDRSMTDPRSADEDQIMDTLVGIKMEIENQLPEWSTKLSTRDSGNRRKTTDQIAIVVENPRDPNEDYYVIRIDDDGEMATIAKGSGLGYESEKTVSASPGSVANALARMIR